MSDSRGRIGPVISGRASYPLGEVLRPWGRHRLGGSLALRESGEEASAEFPGDVGLHRVANETVTRVPTPLEVPVRREALQSSAFAPCEPAHDTINTHPVRRARCANRSAWEGKVGQKRVLSVSPVPAGALVLDRSSCSQPSPGLESEKFLGPDPARRNYLFGGRASYSSKELSESDPWKSARVGRL